MPPGELYFPAVLLLYSQSTIPFHAASPDPAEFQCRPHAVFVAPLLSCPPQSLLLGLMVLAYCDDQCTVPYLTSLYSRNIPPAPLALSLAVLTDGGDLYTDPCLTSPTGYIFGTFPPAPLPFSLAVLVDGGDLYTDPCLTLPLRLLRCPALAGSRLRLTGSVGTSAAAGLRPCGQLPAALRLPPPPPPEWRGHSCQYDSSGEQQQQGSVLRTAAGSPRA